jgi:RAD51-like protein 3
VIDSITPIFRPLLSVVSSQGMRHFHGMNSVQLTASKGHAMMISFMQQLKSLAETHSLTILVLVAYCVLCSSFLTSTDQILNSTSSALPHTHQSRRSSTARKPALGPSFTYMTDTTLWLSKSPASHTIEQADTLEAPIHTAEILRSKFTVCALCI